MQVRRTLLALAAGAAGAAIALGAGTIRWSLASRELLDALDAAREDAPPARYDPRELEGLPAPVQRYFRAALSDAAPIVRAVSVAHRGEFDMSDGPPQWKPFHSTQRVVVRRPGFVWDARIAFVPGVSIHVHDAYVAGRGVLRAAIAGLVTVANVAGTPEVAQGELMRFLAEAAWYPTALLPSQGVQWTPIDDASARATLRDGEVEVSLVVRFGADALIESTYAPARGRTVGDRTVPTPWEGRFGRYEIRDGMRVPAEGDVGWILPEGRRPYWRGRIETLRYEY